MHRFLRASRSVRWQSSPIPPTCQTFTRAATFRAFAPLTTSKPATVLAGRALVYTRFPTTLAQRHLATVVGSTSSVSPVDRTPNVFVDWALFPNFAAILPQCTPDKAIPAFELFVERIEREFIERESRFEPTWEGCIGAVQDLEDQVERAYGIISHLNGVKNSPDLRKVMEHVQPLMVKLTLLMNQSLPKFRALSTLRSTPSAWTALDPVQQRIVDLTLQDMHLAGVGLAPESPEKARFNAIREQLSKLGMQFGNNVLDATSSFGEVVRDRAELVGCSGELLAVLAANARKKGITKEADAEKGPWCVTLDGPTYTAFMMGCENRTLREKIYRASVTKASEGELDNEPIINEILSLKQEEAALLGFSSYASLSLSTKMARDVPSAQRLLSSLFTSSLPAARRELATLTSFASETLGHPVPLQPWDTAYVAEAYRKQTLRLDEEEVARYLAFPRVLEGLFEVAKEVLGVTVKNVGSEEKRRLGLETWHEDVRVFKVEEGGIIRAYFYGDFYSRPEEKKDGAWMDLVTTRMREGGDVRVPVAYLICNQPPPSSSSKPSLMKFSDVRTLFHEFGHCLQHMLTTVDYPQASGIKGIEWDFVEVASQFMENFCYEPGWLARLAAHHETGESMPQEMVDALARNRELLSGMAMLRQIHLAMVDLTLHSDFRPPSVPGDRTVFDVDAEIARDTILVPRLPKDRFLCAFSHIFGGGYSAGYYSYKWSETYSADAYAAFEEARATSVSPDAVRRMGEKYRDTVLALGGGTTPREVWRRFRGREEVDIGALLKHSGLVAEA